MANEMQFRQWQMEQQAQELAIKQKEANINNAIMAKWAADNGIDLNSLGQPPQQPMQPPINTPPPNAMMSLPDGQYGDLKANPLGPIQGQMTPPVVPPSQNMQGQGIGGMVPSFVGGKMSLRTPTTMTLTPEQTMNAGQMLVSNELVPSQIPGRNGKLQAIAAAKAIDPTYDAARADINYFADRTSASGMEKMYNNVKTSHDTFIKNAKIALDMSDSFDRSKIPVLNRAIVSGAKNITGDPEATKLLTALYTTATEYARLTSNFQATGSQLTDSARHEAINLLNAYQNPETIRGLLDPEVGIMTKDTNNRLQAVVDRRSEARGGKSQDNSSGKSSDEYSSYLKAIGAK
jgi:hypothetical protein